jgi:hypothetical protein
MDQSQKIENLLKKNNIFRAGYSKKPVLLFYFIRTDFKYNRF